MLGTFLLALAAGTLAHADDLTITNVNVVDVRAGKVAGSANIVIRGDRIVEIARDARAPQGSRIVEGAGKFVIPGLWDMHVHLAGIDSLPRAPEQWVAYGVTFVRDMGGTPEVLDQICADIGAGKRIGPRVFRAGPTLNGAPNATFHRVVATPSEARSVVGELAARGMDFIKVHNATKPEVFFAIAEAVVEHGLNFVGHVPHGVSTEQASNAGMKTIEHSEVLLEAELFRPDTPAKNIPEAVSRLTAESADRLFDLLVENGTALTPTLSAYEAFVESHDDSLNRAMGRNLHARLLRICKRAHARGVTILAGSDARQNPGWALHRELQLLVDAGLTPAEALRAATIDPAALLGRNEDGEVAVGRSANLVLLDSNPIEDIRNTLAMHGVVLAGRLIDASELRLLADPMSPQSGR